MKSLINRLDQDIKYQVAFVSGLFSLSFTFPEIDTHHVCFISLAWVITEYSSMGRP